MADLKQGDRVPLWVTVNHVHESGAVAYVPPHAIGTMWAAPSDFADVSELVEALRPFAAIDFWSDTRPGAQGFKMKEGIDAVNIKAEHVRRARAALAKFEAAND
jgi:hypothetical protein